MKTKKKTERITERTISLTKKDVPQEKEPFVYGYKALDENLCASAGNGMQFEVGETYEVEGELEFCENGFHFCENLEDTLEYYDPRKNLRFVKIEAYGEVLSDDKHVKQLCRKIKIVKELSKKDILKISNLNEKTSSAEEIFRKNLKLKRLLASKGFFPNVLIDDKHWLVRTAVAEQGYGLDILVKDENPHVRRAVAEQGYELDIFINDIEPDVRLAVARQGYRLDIFVNDKHWNVRAAVAEQGYGLDVLVNDEDPFVREAVAEQGYGLDILIYDEGWYVRLAVAEQGYGLDILINDIDSFVRDAARRQLAKLSANKN